MDAQKAAFAVQSAWRRSHKARDMLDANQSTHQDTGVNGHHGKSMFTLFQNNVPAVVLASTIVANVANPGYVAAVFV